MNKRPCIQPARIEDAAELADLHTLVAEDLTRKLGQGHWSKARTRRSMKDRIEYALDPYQRRELVVLRADTIVGTVLLSRRRVSFWQNNVWEAPRDPALAVFDLAIRPDVQGRGYGRILMEYAETEAQAYSLRWVRLDAYRANPHSNAFYQHLNYTERGELDAGGVQLVMYEKSIPPEVPRGSAQV